MNTTLGSLSTLNLPLVHLPSVDSFEPREPVATHQAGSGSDSPGHQSAMSDFDSIFYSMMLKTMRNSMTENGLFGKESSDTFGGMFDLFMSQHLAKAQPLGIGQILQQYVQSDNRSE